MPLLSWLVILALLMLKTNRCGAAWLIWLPLIFVAVVLQTVVSLLRLPSDADFFLDVAMSLVFGFAVVWLLADHLRRKYRWLTFLCVLLTLAASGGLALLLRQGGGKDTWTLLCATVVVSSIVLTLCGLERFQKCCS